jgi:choline dehydrogenase
VSSTGDAVPLAAKAANLTGASGAPASLKALMDIDVNADDPKRDQTTGIFGSWSHATKAGLRSAPGYSVGDTVNDPAKYPLTLQMYSLVTKVIFDNSTVPKAIGVEYLRGQYLYSADPRFNTSNKGTPGKVYATREVILAGGTFNSPQLLLLSGIGPADDLKALNIPVVVDSPSVGRNLDDNYEPSVASLAAKDLQGNANIFFVFLKAAQSEGRRDTHMWCGPFSFEGFWPGFPTDYGPKQYECTYVHMNPRSQKGYLKLCSADPTDTLIINLNFFEQNSDKDLAAMMEGIKFARNVVKDAPSSFGPFTEFHPCKGSNCTDAETMAFIKKQVYSHHATSTCAIGADGDKMAVLDSKFRVRGVKGLRVVDASAFPEVPGSFPVIPTIVLSEKATVDILSSINGTMY